MGILLERGDFVVFGSLSEKPSWNCRCCCHCCYYFAAFVVVTAFVVVVVISPLKPVNVLGSVITHSVSTTCKLIEFYFASSCTIIIAEW